MKTVLTLVAITLTLSLTAQASSRSTKCSSADASVRIAYGQIANVVQVTEYDWNSEVETPVRDEDGTLFGVQFVEGKNLKKISNAGVCRNGTRGSFSRTTDSQEVTITKLDGSLFSKNTQNVTPDYKAVKAVLICETTTSSILSCSK